MEKSSTLDTLINKFYQDFVRPEDQNFFDVVFSENPSQKALNELLEIWDIEAKGGYTSIMLSYLMKEHPELKFNNYTAPRLKGLFDFHRCQNMRLLSYFSKVGKALNKEGIVPVIFKGAAMKALRPGLSRPMGDVDFLVRPDEFDKTIAITEKCGFQADNRARHSIDMKTADGGWALDIHEFFKVDDLEGKKASKYAEKLNAGFYNRARGVNVFGVNCLIPSNEDLFFITLSNLSKNMTVRTSVKTILFALFDMKFLMAQEDFDWKIVLKNIKISDSIEKIKIAAEFAELIVPGLLLGKLEENLSFEGEVRNYYERVFYDQYHYLDFRWQCHRLLWADVTKKPQLLSKYIAMRFKYQFMRFVRKRPTLVRLYLGDCDAYQ